MPLISKEYVEANKWMHDNSRSFGISAGRFRDFVFGLHKSEGYGSILDYGCGKGVLKQLLPDLPIVEYDPAIEGKDAPPEPAELVICLDVLEHVEPQYLNSVLRDLHRLTKQKLAFNISTVPSSKTLQDGRNVHLIIKPEDWWRKKLQEHFHIMSWEVKDKFVYGEALPIRGQVLREEDLATRPRRRMPHLNQLFEYVRQNSRKYADALHRIETFSVWEGNGDTSADMVSCINLLPLCTDMEAALKDMCSKARLSVLIAMPYPENEQMWRNFFERRLRIVDWHTEDVNGRKGLVMVGSPGVFVQGVHGVGVLDEAERWEQVKAATQRHSKRIQPAEAHERTAILCCYGPSLVDMIPSIKDLMGENADVISVSGAHDFLLQHGIVPKYHVECDPRPHKALNLEKSHPDVQYLIASVCHPEYFERLGEGADIRLWHVSTPSHSQKLVDDLRETSDHCISGGGSVGLRSLPLLHTLGYRDYAVFGMDSSFAIPDDVMAKIEGLMRESPENEPEAIELATQHCTQWADKHAGKRQQVCTVLCRDKLFISSPVLLTYATNFFETIQKQQHTKYRVFGKSLLSAMCAMYASMPAYHELAAQAA